MNKDLKSLFLVFALAWMAWLMPAMGESCGPYTPGTFYCTSPNMSLPIPTIGSETGPQYAQDINYALGVLDSHNHTSGYGVAVPSLGININAALTFNGYAATSLAATTYTAQASYATNYSTYSKGVDLYYRDGSGNEIRLTQSGASAAGPASAPANTVYAGPTSGGSAAPTMRALVSADLPLATASQAGAVSTTTQTFAGAKTFSSGIVVGGNTTGDSNLGTISSVTNAKYYTGSFSLTFGGPWVNQAVTITYTLVGNLVTLQIPALIGTSITGSASTIVSTTGIPSGLRPTAAAAAAMNQLTASRDNSTNPLNPGSVAIATSGVITFVKDLVGNNWTNGNQAGVYGVTVTYQIN